MTGQTGPLLMRSCLIAAAALAACGGVSVEGMQAPAPDAGPDASIDATVDAGAMDAGAVLPDLHGARLEVPCNPPSVPGMDGCTSAIPPPLMLTAGGEPGATYSVTIRVRGVLEHKSYAGGEGEGQFRIGGTPDDTTWNVYRLQVGDTVYHLNAGVSSERFCHAIDYQAAIQVRTGDEVVLREDDTDGLMIVNIDDRSPPAPIVVPDVAPYPAAFDGQFLQIDVVAVEKIR